MLTIYRLFRVKRNVILMNKILVSNRKKPILQAEILYYCLGLGHKIHAINIQ